MNFYSSLIKPVLFKFDAEIVHNLTTAVGEYLEDQELIKLLAYQNPKLSQNINGLNFVNPIGLAAGFDYDGHLARVLKNVGFGFNTVGTVTAKPYEGNPKPRLGRLPKSKSLLVNKGFKSEGVDKVIERLNLKEIKNNLVGISVGSSNLPEINTINKAIDDYFYTLEKVKALPYVSYLELNISCPNTSMTENFANKKNLDILLAKIKFTKPMFIKMPNEIAIGDLDELIKVALKYPISGFVLSNLVKNRNNKFFNKSEIEAVANLKGNFSGRPTFENSNQLIAHVYQKFGRYTKIIGCGGVFSAADAYHKIKLGASLVQMLTGLIYEGPQVVGEINRGLVTLLERDGYSNISQAVGSSDN
jgi:dihydroorotate dehydrogenase